MAHNFSQLFSKHLGVRQNTEQYRGRFAPSPSGPLHFGSLLTALGSYLQARANNGLWFVRIEDIDKPREQPGAVQLILDALNAFGMVWDIDPNTQNTLAPEDQNCLVQTRRLNRYTQILNALQQNHLVYACNCTRKQIKQAGGHYQQTCREKALPFTDNAIRLINHYQPTEIIDHHFGAIPTDLNFDTEDYIIKRRDGLFAYQLVVVIDDIDQGITEVVRGADIMPLTHRQVGLYQLFGQTPPRYLHLPLIASEPGRKLSKQNHATAIDLNNPKPELLEALSLLGLPVTKRLEEYDVAEIMRWAVEHWQLTNLPNQSEIIR